MLKFYQKTNPLMPTAKAILDIARLLEQTGGRNPRPIINHPETKQTRRTRTKPRRGVLRSIVVGGDIKFVTD